MERSYQAPLWPWECVYQISIEFGKGLNILFGGDKIMNSAPGVVYTGKSFNYSRVSIPINLGFTTNPARSRYSNIFGNAITE